MGDFLADFLFITVLAEILSFILGIPLWPRNLICGPRGGSERR
jgi:hypothetical protein